MVPPEGRRFLFARVLSVGSGEEKLGALRAHTCLSPSTQSSGSCLSVDKPTGLEDQSSVHSHGVSTWESLELEPRELICIQVLCCFETSERERERERESGAGTLAHDQHLSVTGPSAD